MCILTFYLEGFLFALDTSCVSYLVFDSSLPVNILQTFFFFCKVRLQDYGFFLNVKGLQHN